MAYTKVGPFVNDSSPFLNAANMNTLETGIYDAHTLIATQGDSGGVVYDHGGTGAVATTVEAKLQTIVSATDFGATGDGTTDDTTAVQAAIDYVASTGGGIVHFPNGTYLLGQIILKDHVVLRGDWIAGTVLKLADSTNDDFLKSDGFDTLEFAQASAKTITAITQANPAAVTSASHGFSDGDYVHIESVSGMTEVNDTSFIVANATTNTFTLQDTDGAAVDSSAYTAYTSGGTAKKTNYWLNSDGVLSFCGLQNLTVDGNRANNISGDGLKLYVKALFLNNVIIRDCIEDGIYSEAGDRAGQTDWEDLPEGHVGPLWIRNCGGHGWHMRGPHDISVSQIVINECGIDGWRIERLPGVYSGAADVGMAHIYANDGYGVYSNTSFRYRQLISESNGKEGVYLAGADQVQGSLTQLYRNCTSSGTYNMVVDSLTEHCLFNHLLFRNPSSAGHGGLQIAGDHIVLNAGQFYGTNGVSAGTALDVTGDAKYCRVVANVRRFNASGGYGLKTNDGGAGQYNKFDVVLQDCDTLWDNGTVGNANEYSIRGYVESGQTAFSGQGPNTDDEDEIWNVNFRLDPVVATITGITQANPAVVTATAHGLSNNDVVTIASVAGMTEVNGYKFLVANVTANTFELSGIDSSGFTAYSSGGTATQAAAMKSAARISSGAFLKPVDLNSTAVQDISIPHGLMATPEIEDVSYGLVYAGSNTTWVLDYLALRSVDAANLNFRVRLTTAAGTAADGNIVAQVEL